MVAWPLVFAPHAAIVPSDFKATVCPLPETIVVAESSPLGIVVSPAALLPQATSCPRDAASWTKIGALSRLWPSVVNIAW